MARVKRGILRTKKRHKLYRQTKGYRAGRKNILRLVKTAVKKSGQRAYDHRRLKKRDNRGLWQIKINAAVRKCGLNYSTFMGKMKKKNIALDRKILAELAEFYPQIFSKIVEEVKKS